MNPGTSNIRHPASNIEGIFPARSARLRTGLWQSVLPMVAALGFFVAAQSGFGATVDREAALRDITHNVIAAGFQDLASKCQSFSNSIAQLASKPDATAVDQARQAWVAMFEAADRLRCFQTGPILSREYAAAFYYSRITPGVIEGEISSSNKLDEAYVGVLGGNAKGLFASEYLLFGHRGFPSAPELNAERAKELLVAPTSARRREFLLAVTREVTCKAAQLASDWSATGEQDAGPKFVAGGQTSINTLVNQLAHAIEDFNQSRLNFALYLPKPLNTQIYRIEASPSGASLQGAVASLEGMQTFYRGANGQGLADVVKQVNAPLAKKIDEQFDATLAAIKAIDEPLDKAVMDKRDAIQNACDKVKTLEILFKVDLASALGVTITFISGDGD
jgi:predicted lipoprotein